MKTRIKIALITLLVGTDVLTKAICLSMLPGRDVVLLRNILSLSLVKNTGMAFSFLSNSPVLITVLSAAVIVLVQVLLFARKNGRLLSAALCMVAAGGIGNMIDRMFMGAVTDMIRLDFIYFPVFNFADICITVGAVLTACAVLFGKEGNS